MRAHHCSGFLVVSPSSSSAPDHPVQPFPTAITEMDSMATCLTSILGVTGSLLLFWYFNDSW
jgi:hypothetical protein